jgi:S-adenosylmethionine:tRNA ribosyltransferase-isomerase
VQGGVDFDVTPRSAADASATALVLRVLGPPDDDGLLDVFLWAPSGEPLAAVLAACGHVPLPPYIKRQAFGDDVARYQTVYARREGAVAAPTAGLHLTHGMLERAASNGCDLAFVTLHVGLGTFLPVQAPDLDQHPMHAESFEISLEAAAAIAQARARGAAVVAVGTTSARALESAADPDRPGHVRAMAGETRLLIQPGYTWRVVDVLLTNFHQPRSTLMALVCSFAGIETVLAAYGAAVRDRYRFFSYGDAMLLWRGT